MTALVAACALNPGDYFAMNSGAIATLVKQMGPHVDMGIVAAKVQALSGYLPVDIGMLSQQTGEQLVGRAGGGVALRSGWRRSSARCPACRDCWLTGTTS